MSLRLGYCCINMTLQETEGISVNSGMIRKTFDSKGLEFVSEKIISNFKSLQRILEWNFENGILVYRMSSSMMPWMSEYHLPDLPHWNDQILPLLRSIGQYVKQNNLRLSFHPGHFVQLASLNQVTFDNSVNELYKTSQILFHMNLEGHKYPINIHIGGVYGAKKETMNRFVSRFDDLDEAIKSRLILENDDKVNGYQVDDLYKIWLDTDIPICFDYHHHAVSMIGHEKPISEEDSVYTAALTWPGNVNQLCHYSSAKKVFEDPKVKMTAHADYLYNQIEDYGLELDIEIEAKAKEKALLKYRTDFENI